MRKLLLVAVLTIVAAAPARAQDILLGEPQLITQMPLDASQAFNPAALVPSYSNITNFLGSAYAHGNAASISGILTTSYVADDITINPPDAGKPIIQFSFSVANLGGANVSSRARVRFHAPDGAGGGPGTYLGGFTFNAISFPPGVGLYNASIAPLVLPGQFWAGMTFDNSGTGASAAALNGLGQGIFDPPSIGTSADIAFRTTAASIGNVNNPPGATFSFGGAPVANFGWEFVYDQPVPTQESSWGRVKAQYRN